MHVALSRQTCHAVQHWAKLDALPRWPFAQNSDSLLRRNSKSRPAALFPGTEKSDKNCESPSKKTVLSEVQDDARNCVGKWDDFQRFGQTPFPPLSPGRTVHRYRRSTTQAEVKTRKTGRPDCACISLPPSSSRSLRSYGALREESRSKGV